LHLTGHVHSGPYHETPTGKIYRPYEIIENNVVSINTGNKQDDENIRAAVIDTDKLYSLRQNNNINQIGIDAISEE
jgi:hypothetical protein